MHAGFASLFLVLVYASAAIIVLDTSNSASDIPIVWSAYTVTYTINIGIGTPAQTVLVSLDTSVGDIYLTGLFSKGYSLSKSSTGFNTSASSEVLGVQAFIFTDVIRLGDRAVDGAAFFMEPQGRLRSIGLALGGTAKAAKPPIWQLALGDATEFGLWLARIPLSSQLSDGNGGVLTFGSVNTSFFSGDVEYLNLTGPAATYWQLDISAFGVRGVQQSITARSAIFDTGYTRILGPDTDVKTLWDAVPGATSSGSGSYQYRPSPSFSVMDISFGGRTWPISDADINLGPIAPENSECVGAIQGYNGPLGLPDRNISSTWLVGTPFLKNVYSVFRHTPPSLGFAELSSLAGGTGIPNSATAGSTAMSSATSTPSGPIPTPTLTPTPMPRPNNVNSLVVGAVVGGVAALLLVGILCFFLTRRRVRKNRVSTWANSSGDVTARAPALVPFKLSAQQHPAGPKATRKGALQQSALDPADENLPRKRAPVEAAHASRAEAADGDAVVLATPPGIAIHPAIRQELETLREEMREVRGDVRWLALADRPVGGPPPEYESV